MNASLQEINANKLIKRTVYAVVLIYLLPIILLGQHSYIRIHDTLEGEWVWLKLLVDGHTAFNFHTVAQVLQVMKGLPRDAFPPVLSVNLVLVQLFGDFNAYIISSLIIRILGFTGMVRLLKDYFIKDENKLYIVWASAICFVVMPVFIPFGLSVLGQPFLLWAFLNLQHKKKLFVSYSVIILFPFYSSIVWLSFPFILLLSALAVYFQYKDRVTLHYILAGLIMTGLFVLVNFPMLGITLLQPGFLSHRLAYNLYMLKAPALAQSLAEFCWVFFVTHYHVANFIPAAALIAILLVVRKTDHLLISIFAAIIAICVFQSFYSLAEYWMDDKISLFKSFRFNRFSILLPFLWLLGFAIALNKMSSIAIYKPLIFPLIYVQLFLALGANDEVLHNYRTLIGHQKFPGYDNYTASRQFDEIKNYVGQPQNSYYVASLGISPSVAQYNGFYTLDGLLSIYELRYKEDFRKIIAPEIAKSDNIRQYYDGWGNRCYIFSSELGIKHEAFNCYKFKHQSVEHLDVNMDAFRKMGGKYLISAVEIKNSAAIGLHLDRVFRDSQSWWTIYLYSVNKSSE
jgi:hypothetical protein